MVHIAHVGISLLWMFNSAECYQDKAPIPFNVYISLRQIQTSLVELYNLLTSNLY